MSKSRDLADILSGNIGSRNVTTDGQKLDTIETNAKDDQTKADIDALNIDADTLDGNDSSYFTNYTDTQIAAIPEASFANLTGKPTTVAGYGITDAYSGSFADLTNKPTTLAGYGITDSLEPADATILKDADIGVNVLAYDANVVSDANYVATDENFTTADHSKLDGIEANATADQTKADIDALNIDADKLDGQHGSYYTDYADTAIANLVDSAPGTLNTLNELADALGDDPNFATTMTTALAGKVDDSQVLTNVPSGALFTDTNTTYSVGDGGLTQKNFTSTLKTKLDGIASNATNTATPAITSNGSTPSLASGITAAEVRSLIGAGTSSSDTVYTHPTFNGDDFSIDTGHLSGATVIDDLDINITTNSEGHVTDANATVGTRNLTLANLGYTGATNANNYSHPTGNGNNHIPSGGSAGQILQYSSAGTAAWTTPTGGASFPAAPTWTSPQNTFTSSGTWTKPGSIGTDDWVIIYLLGGGGGTAWTAAGAGGGGGATVIAVQGGQLPSTITCTVGAAGGSGGHQHGARGGSTSVTISSRTFTAIGGAGSSNGNSGSVGDSQDKIVTSTLDTLIPTEGTSPWTGNSTYAGGYGRGGVWTNQFGTGGRVTFYY